MRKYFLGIILVIFLSQFLNAEVLVRFPEHSFVFDNADLLSSEQIVNLEKQLLQIKDSSNAEVIVISVDSSVNTDVKRYAELLSNQWIESGKLSQDNIIFILDPTDRKFAIIPSEELAGKIDIKLLKKIEDKYLLPQTRNKKYYEGINNSIAQIKLVLSGQMVKSDLDSNYRGLFFIFVTLMVIFFIILFPILQYKAVLQNHFGTRKPGFFRSLMLMNTFGAQRGGFDASFKNSDYESRKAALLRGAGGAMGVW
ncbi:hypothetical protein MYP_4359 [Sporocytophaga myxococcoides]|uniref:TPM domain-containing protein n=1 Tax=Sporocytophaga myxococcoides TaxID=153721 RepID=A0A098LKU6_9BACT|nr:TPM domain-containing protein [Sporocytophaga myxococcoides]GAL87129.1 hypothetical protein MYP_4359 [Sporocytophaga myxococcoides]